MGTTTDLTYAVDYDSLVSMLQAKAPSTRTRGRELLVRAIKSELFSPEVAGRSEDRIYVGQMSDRVRLDVAVGVSVLPYEGNLVMLTNPSGRYLPTQVLTRLGFITSLEGVKLFPGSLEQLVVNMSGGGTDWRHWAKDIYSWDGKAMRIIWDGWIKDVTTHFSPGADDDDKSRVMKTKVSFRDLDGDGVKEIMAVHTQEDGVLNPRTLEIRKLRSRTSWNVTYRWDKTFDYYLAYYGRIRATLSVRCWERTYFQERFDTLTETTRVGVLVKPNSRDAREEISTVVLPTKDFCQVPKSSLQFEP